MDWIYECPQCKQSKNFVVHRTIYAEVDIVLTTDGTYDDVPGSLSVIEREATFIVCKNCRKSMSPNDIRKEV